MKKFLILLSGVLLGLVYAASTQIDFKQQHSLYSSLLKVKSKIDNTNDSKLYHAESMSVYAMNNNSLDYSYARNSVDALNYPNNIQDCEQITLGGTTPENGVGMFHIYIVANDISVNPNESFKLNALDFNAVVNVGYSVLGAELSFYEDTPDGGPGTQIGFIPMKPVSSVEYIGEYTEQLKRYRVTYDLDTPFTFLGAEESVKKYWVGIKIDLGVSPFESIYSYMEVTSNINTLDQAYIFDETSGWMPSSSVTGGVPSDGVASFYGDCEPIISCEDSPTSGSIVQGPLLMVCPGTKFLLSVSGQSQAEGINYQWQSKSFGAEEWGDIENETNPVLILSEGISQDTDFRFVVSCVNSGETSYSEGISVQIKPPTECYCVSRSDCFVKRQINNVNLVGDSITLNNESDCTPGGYGQYLDLPKPDLGLNENYFLNVGTNHDHPAVLEVKAWIDFDQNGIFEEDELIGNTSGGGMGEEGWVGFNFTVPEDAATGQSRLRIRLTDGQPYDVDPCQYVSFGETEDYLITILGLSECTGSPIPPIAGENIEVCANEPFTLNAEDTNSGFSGFSATWQYSLDESNWTDIPDSSLPDFTVLDGVSEITYYRYKITCVFSGESAVSDSIEVSIKDPTECYCHQTSDCSVAVINNLTLTGENVTIDNSTECSTGGYGDYTTLLPADLFTNETYTISIFTEYWGFVNCEIRLWADFNQNGVFEEDELIASTNNEGMSDSTETLNVTIPSDVLPGIYRMRARIGFLGNDMEPCSFVFYSETEDYSVEILQSAESECIPPSNVQITNVTEATADVSWSPVGEEESWQIAYGYTGFDPDAEGEIILVNGTPAYTLDNLEEGTQYDIYVRALCNGEDDVSDWAGPVAFTTENLSLSEWNSQNVKLYPNPFTNEIFIQLPENVGGSYTFKVSDLIGKTIYSQQQTEKSFVFNGTSLPKGIYILSIESNGKIIAKKVVKK